MFLPNVQDEPRPWLARAVLLGARIVTAMVVGSGALLGLFRASFIVVADLFKLSSIDVADLEINVAQYLSHDVELLVTFDGASLQDSEVLLP